MPAADCARDRLNAEVRDRHPGNPLQEADREFVRHDLGPPRPGWPASAGVIRAAAPSRTSHRTRAPNIVRLTPRLTLANIRLVLERRRSPADRTRSPKSQRQQDPERSRCRDRPPRRPSARGPIEEHIVEPWYRRGSPASGSAPGASAVAPDRPTRLQQPLDLGRDGTSARPAHPILRRSPVSNIREAAAVGVVEIRAADRRGAGAPGKICQARDERPPNARADLAWRPVTGSSTRS